MLEILIIIAVVKAFCALAVDKGRSKALWGFVGALSYYGPLLLMSFFLLPMLVGSGMLPFITRDNYFFVGIIINLVTGVLCCLVTYGILKSLPGADAKSAPAAYRSGESALDLDDDNPYRAHF